MEASVVGAQALHSEPFQTISSLERRVGVVRDALVTRI